MCGAGKLIFLLLFRRSYLDLVGGRWCCREEDILRHVSRFEVFARGDTPEVGH